MTVFPVSQLLHDAIIRGIFAVVLCCLLLSLDAQTIEKYRERELGNKAFSDGMYSLAAKFYRRFKENSVSDPQAHREACLKLLAAYVRAGAAREADDEYTYILRSFEQDQQQDEQFRHQLSYWRAAIAVLNAKHDNAIRLLNELSLELPQESELYYRTLDLLGSAYAKSQQWDQAEKTYALLEFAGRGTDWAKEAGRKKVLAVVLSGALDKARTLLPDGADKVSREKLQGNLLHLLILVREDKIAEAEKFYAELRKQASGPDAMWYMSVQALAEAVMELKQYAAAARLFADAANFAISEHDRQNSLQSCINAYAAAGEKNDAISAAQKFLREYPRAANADSLRLQLARLLAELDKKNEAIEVYDKVINTETGTELRLSAAREAGQLLTLASRYDDAKSKFEFLAENAKDGQTRGEGKFRLAELLFLKSEFNNAAAAFADVAEKFPEWKEKAIFYEVRARMQLKDYDSALAKLDQFEKEFRQSPLLPDVLFLHARARQLNGDTTAAMEAFAKFAAAYPGHAQAPRAWFEAGKISHDLGKFSNAEKAFSALLSEYRRHALAPNALYRRIHAKFADGDNPGAKDDVSRIAKDYPDSIYSVHALFWLADELRNQGENADAEKVLKNIAANYAKSADKAARALYEAAELCASEQRNENAISYLDEMNERYPEEAIISEGQFLRGNIFMSENEFKKAIPFFRKATERRPESNLETASLGRLGDAYYSMAWETPDGTNAQQALALYKQILERKGISADWREQTLYKAGKCEEILGDHGAALASYLEVVYNYETDLEQGRKRDPIWFAKAALAAAKLYEEKDTPEAAEAALNIYGRMIRAGIEPLNDLKKKISDIRDKYGLKE